MNQKAVAENSVSVKERVVTLAASLGFATASVLIFLNELKRDGGKIDWNYAWYAAPIMLGALLVAYYGLSNEDPKK